MSSIWFRDVQIFPHTPTATHRSTARTCQLPFWRWINSGWTSINHHNSSWIVINHRTSSLKSSVIHKSHHFHHFHHFPASLLIPWGWPMALGHAFDPSFWAPRRGFDARSWCRMPSSTARWCTPVRSAGRRRCSCYSVPARCLTLWCSLGKKWEYRNHGKYLCWWLDYKGISQKKGL